MKQLDNQRLRAYVCLAAYVSNCDGAASEEIQMVDGLISALPPHERAEAIADANALDASVPYDVARNKFALVLDDDFTLTFAWCVLGLDRHISAAEEIVFDNLTKEFSNVDRDRLDVLRRDAYGVSVESMLANYTPTYIPSQPSSYPPNPAQAPIPAPDTQLAMPQQQAVFSPFHQKSAPVKQPVSSAGSLTQQINKKITALRADKKSAAVMTVILIAGAMITLGALFLITNGDKESVTYISAPDDDSYNVGNDDYDADTDTDSDVEYKSSGTNLPGDIQKLVNSLPDYNAMVALHGNDYSAIRDDAYNRYNEIRDKSYKWYNNLRDREYKAYNNLRDEKYKQYQDKVISYDSYEKTRKKAYDKYEKTRKNAYDTYEKTRKKTYNWYESIRKEALDKRAN